MAHSVLDTGSSFVQVFKEYPLGTKKLEAVGVEGVLCHAERDWCLLPVPGSTCLTY